MEKPCFFTTGNAASANLEKPPIDSSSSSSLSDAEMGGKKPETMVKRQRESLPTKLAHFVGMVLQMLVVALPKDIFRWLFLSRKCVRGQTIVITGGASGIGQRMAEIFADPAGLGAQVAIIDCNLEAAEKVAEGIIKSGGSARAWKCDIVDGDAVRKCAQEIKQHFGRVDIVVCNAAILYFAYTLELKDAEIKRAMDVNVVGTINTIRAFLPTLEAQRHGQIVAICSIAGFFGETFGMAYCPTKFAVRGIMDCLRMELCDRGLEDIVCTTICPFFVRTPMILNKGIRPVSRWIPFMSVERCSSLIIDAMLKEKVLAFMPTWLGLVTTINSLFSLNMQRVARDFINFRYEDPDEETVQQKANEAVANGQSNGVGKANNRVDHVRHRQVPKDFFELVSPIWWVLIIPALLFLFLIYNDPSFIYVPWLGKIGELFYDFATQNTQLLYWLNIFAWALNFMAAICALYLSDALQLSHKSSLQWFLQTALIGLPSIRILLKHWRKEK